MIQRKKVRPAAVRRESARRQAICSLTDQRTILDVVRFNATGIVFYSTIWTGSMPKPTPCRRRPHSTQTHFPFLKLRPRQITGRFIILLLACRDFCRALTSPTPFSAVLPPCPSPPPGP
jgi:hypothetical protein